MNILVLGYYDRHNLGDDMFKLTMPKLFPESTLTFTCTDDFNGNHKNYDAIVCGGGDIVNDYFNKKITKLLTGFKGQVFAVGIGIPYPGLIKKGYLDIYDHVFIRERTDLMKIQRRLGSQYGHYLPDLGFALDFPECPVRDYKIEKKRRIGVFLAQSLHKHKPIFFSLCQFISDISKDYEVILIRFNTSNSPMEDDKYINNDIYDCLCVDCPNLKNDPTVYNVQEMLTLMTQLDYGVCMRFHSHIFSTISELPFFSIYSTRKVGLYIDEEDYHKWSKPITLDGSGKPLKFDYKDAYEKFLQFIEDAPSIVERLKFIKNRYKFLLETSQPEKLILNNRLRPKILDNVENVDVMSIYNRCCDILKKKSGYDPRSGKKENINIDIELSEEIASKLCMDITGMPSSKYLYGTIKNVIQKPWDLKEMIKWIAKDFTDNYKKSCNRIFLDSYCQDTFRGVHRAGWQYVIDYMRSMHTFNGVICDMYLDLSFLWGKKPLKESGVVPYTSPWIGFIHHCPDDKYTEYNTIKMVQDIDFQKSLIVCKGLICLTDYLNEWFKKELSKLGYEDIPVYTLRHPTIIPKIKFSPQDFLNNKNKKLINVGAWYRNPFTIYRICPKQLFTKCALKGKDMDNYFYSGELSFNRETIINNTATNKWEHYLFEYIKSSGIIEKLPSEFSINLHDDYKTIENKTVKALHKHINDLINSVNVLSYLPNDEYDKIFSENVIFLNLIDASAANTVIECIVRNTPLVVNKIPPVVEYLGEDYPLYYETLDDISNILTIDNIVKTSKYLQNMDKTFLSVEYFIESFRDEKIYNTLIC